MSVLDRVKNFLPIIEKANQELEEKIKLQGASSIIIDSNLEKIPIHDSNDDNKSLIQEVDETKSDNINEVVQNDIKKEDETNEDNQQISVEFAIGDFQDSIIAQLEDTEKTNENR